MFDILDSFFKLKYFSWINESLPDIFSFFPYLIYEKIKMKDYAKKCNFTKKNDI
jgi:hypothetical protein